MGGVSLAGMVRNRETFGLTLPNISMIRHTWTEEQRFSKGQPKTGAELAMDLERIAEIWAAAPLRPYSSSPSPDQPARWSRRKAICRRFARSATSTACCWYLTR